MPVFILLLLRSKLCGRGRHSRRGGRLGTCCACSK
jgi:hypothetical protein